MKTVDLKSLPTRKVLTLEVACIIANAVLEAAAEKNIDYLEISVVDDGGNLIFLSRQSGAEVIAVEIGIAKARTAATQKSQRSGGWSSLTAALLPFSRSPE